MKLTTEKGELTLPQNFSFEIQKDSAFFSDSGSASIAATIPATSEDQAKLGFPTRLGRSEMFKNSYPAIISQGIFQKKGLLVIDSASSSGMVCSIALEDSEFYAQFKDNNIKEIFSSKIRKNYKSISEWYDWLMKIYRGELSDELTIFPVAVNKRIDDKGVSYDSNNCPVQGDSEIWPIEHSARIVKEGDEDISVPDGYGLAPFLKFPNFLEDLFELCGYHVDYNCFREHDFLRNLVLVHNCADCLCKSQIDYSDLVPSCKVSELLEWMKNKFMSQIIVNPTDKTVQIILMANVTMEQPDIDLSAIALSGVNLTFSKSSRTILSTDTSLEGAEPAAATVQDLLDKYGSVKQETTGDLSDSPCLALELATGQFYEIHTSLCTHDRISRKKVPVGSNCFNFDRKNSEESESLAAADLFPVMVWNNGILMPYIGDRIHRNTSYNDSGKDSEQKIIIVDYAGLSKKVTYNGGGERVPVDNAGSHYYYATTQKYDNAGHLRSGRISLVPEELYFAFFQDYNNVLLNNSVKVTGSFLLTPEQITQYDVYRTKIYKGQLLLPLSMTYEVGDSIRCRTASFLLLKEFKDGRSDEPIIYPAPLYKWVLNDSQIQEKKAELESIHITPGSGKYITFEYDDDYSKGKKDVFLLPPNAAGESSARIMRNVLFKLHVGHSSVSTIGSFSLEEWFDSVKI